MSRWFRHYAGLCRDDKLVRAALKAGQTVERVVWVWAAILESAAEIDDAGRYDLDTAEAAYFLRASTDDVDGIVAALAACGRIADGRVVKWGDRQFQSDRSAERQKRHREKQKTGGDVQRGRHEPLLESDSDGDVTALSRHSDAPETETETETETEAEKKRKNTPPSQASGGAGSYSDDFEKVWTAYRPIAAKNATKADAARAHANLNEADREACLTGVQRYASWLIAERQKRPEVPAKHLATFIHKRGWEPFLEGEALATGRPTVRLSEDDPLWPKISARYQSKHGKPPPLDRDRGWRFTVADYPELSTPTP